MTAISLKAETLADNIEQLMFERGEYDFSDDDRIRWIDSSREATKEKIAKDLKNGNIDTLYRYLDGEVATIDEEDELLETAETLLQGLEKYQDNLQSWHTYLEQEEWQIINGDVNFATYGGYAVRSKDDTHFQVMQVVTEVDGKPMNCVRYAELDEDSLQTIRAITEKDGKPLAYTNYEIESASPPKKEKAVALMDDLPDIGNPKLISNNELMDFFALHHFETAYEQSKGLYIPTAELQIAKEHENEFETVDFSQENLLVMEDNALHISKPNYHGTGEVEMKVMLSEKELQKLFERSPYQISEDERIFANVYLNVDAKTKNVSISVVVKEDGEPSEYDGFPLKAEETAEIFDFINENCQNQLDSDIHDIIRELRKGTERPERVHVYEM